jgi:Fe2+ transport system protein B
MDTSWIDEEDIEESILEKEPMNEIQCYYIYVAMNQNISNVTKKVQNLEIYQKIEDYRIISRDNLLQMIHSNKTYLSKKHRLLEILLYNVDSPSSESLLEVGDELSFSKIMNVVSKDKLEEPSALRTVTTMDEILIPPSLCIFHETNCLYFIFQEVYQDRENQMTKPILKIMSDILPRINSKKTKRVAFKEDIRHTKKRISN